MAFNVTTLKIVVPFQTRFRNNKKKTNKNIYRDKLVKGHSAMQLLLTGLSSIRTKSYFVVIMNYATDQQRMAFVYSIYSMLEY